MGPFKAVLFFVVYLATGVSVATPNSSDPTVVSSVDFAQYAGAWEEIAHSPNFFQRGCVRSSAEYAVLAPGKVSVHNICHKADGSTRDIRGEGTTPNPAEPAKLKVRFNFFAKGDYWIVRLDPDYRWAVVSGPKRGSLFILARQGPMEPKLLQSILDDLKSDSFKTDSLVFDQFETMTSAKRL